MGRLRRWALGRHRALQALSGGAALVGGVAVEAGVGWCLVSAGALLLLDLLMNRVRVPRAIHRTQQRKGAG